MGEKKIKRSEIPKDWFLHVDSPSGRRRINAAAERTVVRSLDDIPTYVSAKQAAAKLNANPKTVADWMAKKYLKSTKIRGRRFTTPEWIQDFIEREAAKHG